MFHRMGLVQIQMKFGAENEFTSFDMQVLNNMSQKAHECTSEHLKFQTFPGRGGGHVHKTPLECGGRDH